MGLSEYQIEPNYNSYIPAKIRYDKTLSAAEKLLFAEITALACKAGYCYATNKYFSEILGVIPQTISRQITKLIDKGYLRRILVYKNGTREVEQRRLYPLSDMPIPIVENANTCIGKNANTPIVENAKENNTSNNTELVINTADCIKSNNKQKNTVFVKPTIEELQAYTSEINAGIDAENFYYYYEARGWQFKDGSKMKSWKATVQQWKRREEERKKEEEVKSEQRPYNPYGY